MRSTRTIRMMAALAAAALTLTALAGCAGGTPKPGAKPAAKPATTTAFPVTVTDDAGRSVTLKAAAKRIVSLAPANTEIVYGLDQFSRIVGVTTWDDYPAQVKDVAKMGDFTTPNLEAIAAVKPDLILVTGGVQADVVTKLEALGALLERRGVAWDQVAYVSGGQVWTVKLDGSDARQVTFLPGEVLETTMAPDGRLLFSVQFFQVESC